MHRRQTSRYPAFFLAVLGLTFLTQEIGLTQPISKDSLRTSPKIVQLFREVVAGPSQSTVRVLCDGKDAALGVIVEADGWILTKASVLNGPTVCKLKDGRELPAKVVGAEDAHDLALLKVEAKDLTPITWRKSKEVAVGQWVASVGPATEPVAIGVVSVATRGFKPGDQPPKNLGSNSGYLGVMLEEAEGGAKIRQIVPDSPADKAGLKIADIIIQAGPRKVVDMESLINAVQSRKPGEEITLKVVRAKASLEFKTTLGRLPKTMIGNPQERLGSALSNRRGGFPTILQHDTVLSPSDCGGPLCDLDGKAVGLNIARAGRTETYAIPSEAILNLVENLKSGKLAPTEETSSGKTRPLLKGELLNVEGELTTSTPLDKRRTKCFHKVHDVQFKAGQEYTIDLSSGDFDGFLRLEDDRGRQLAEDDDGGDDLDARITYRATADGTYRLIVTTFNPGETGRYRLTVRQTGDKK